VHLQLSDCSHRFAQPNGEWLKVLRGVDLEFRSGEISAIVGRSGCGKSTLLNILGLMTDPSEGRYYVDNVAVGQLREKDRAKLRASGFGFVFQDYCLLEGRTAAVNITLPLLNAPRSEYRDRWRRAKALLADVGLEGREDARSWQLSGGEQQRIALARALAARPAFLLADEPTGSLDQATGKAIIDLLFHLVRRDGMGLVLVTHDQQLAAKADRTIILDDSGRVAADRGTSCSHSTLG
jgi:putative ABC transport system ATP-binding protein